jgi:hypothetical protein
MKPFAIVAASAALVLCTGDAFAQRNSHAGHNHGARAETTVTAHRVAVSDAATGLVRIIDLGTGNTLSTSTLASPARLWRGASGRYIYAVQGQAGRVSIFDGGVSLVDHGDHADIRVSAPRLLQTMLSGERPSHFNQGGGRIAAFFDGSGSGQVIRESDLVAGRVRLARTVEGGGNHHGVAKPIGRDLTAITIQTPGQNLPDAVELRDRQGAASERIACPRLHGEAATGRFTAFGCANGVAVYESTPRGMRSRHIAYPETLPTGRMIRNAEGAAGFSLLAADFGPDGMVIFDPSSQTGDFRFVQLPARRIAFDLHPEPGDKLYVLIEDGTLVLINPLNATVTRSAPVTPRYAMEQGVVRPRISSIGPHVVVSNPAQGEIIVLDAETLVERRRIKLEGQPFDVFAFGGSGSVH